MARVSAVAAALFAAASAADVHDLRRAHTPKPLAEYKGDSQEALSKVLNSAMLKTETLTRECHLWSAEELQGFMFKVLEHRSPDLDEIYQGKDDRRRLRRGSLEEYLNHWDEARDVVKGAPHLHKPIRDSHCRQAVMLWTHHLTEEKRGFLRDQGLQVPLLPEEPKVGCHGRNEKEVGVCASAEVENSCDWCHSLQSEEDQPGKSPPNALDPKYVGPDDGNPHGWDRKRRCDQDYKPNMCGMCEGVGGVAKSDRNDDIELASCVPVLKPEEVNMSTVAPPIYPKQWTHSKYHDVIIGRKRDPFCFAFFPENNSSGTECYRAEDGITKYYDIEREAVRTDYNIKMKGAFGLLGNITSNVIHVGRYMWIVNHLWLGINQCVCTDPGRLHCTHTPNCPSYAWHYDFAKTAQYLGRERIGVEWIGEMELDHFIVWSHHIWTDPVSKRLVRLWKPWNGLQVYEPSGWSDTIADPSVFDSPPAMCKKGGARIRINCNDDGSFKPGKSEGLELLEEFRRMAEEAAAAEAATSLVV